MPRLTSVLAVSALFAAAQVANAADAALVSGARSIPLVKQRLRNNCETAALSMLLATGGANVDQRTLQRQLPQARPLDPARRGGTELWGDPEAGFVGRVQGGGPAGGYGVYERPILALASRTTKPLNLTGEPPGAIYQRLLQGHAVMTWIGLSNGPDATWRTTRGGLVHANFGEHTVVLTGVRGNRLIVNDPLDGRRKSWSKERFELMWERLGRRAVSV